MGSYTLTPRNRVQSIFRGIYGKRMKVRALLEPDSDEVSGLRGLMHGLGRCRQATVLLLHAMVEILRSECYAAKTTSWLDGG
jgi:hypothetical protein